MQLKIYRYFLGTYGAILLVSLALFYLFPKNDLQPIDPRGGGGAEDETFPGYCEAWMEGKLDQIGGLSPHKQWHFDYSGKILGIVPVSDSAPHVLIKRTAAGTEGLIAVEYRLARKETFFIERLKPYTVVLTGDRLSVGAYGRNEFKFKEFARDFTTKQFEAGDEDESHGWFFSGSDFIQELYLYIPEGLEVEYDPEAMFLRFADEE